MGGRWALAICAPATLARAVAILNHLDLRLKCVSPFGGMAAVRQNRPVRPQYAEAHCQPRFAFVRLGRANLDFFPIVPGERDALAR
jgi:hypothetical protein